MPEDMNAEQAWEILLKRYNIVEEVKKNGNSRRGTAMSPVRAFFG